MVADALASAVSVLGPERGLALIETIPEASCMVITDGPNGVKAHFSTRFPACTGAMADQVP
jgi:thiamine biosynthesis lipoprotein ApbE